MLQLDPGSIIACARLEWSPQIGDPTVAGWLTVVAYAICAFLAFKVLSRLDDRREKAFWCLTMLAMMFLCVNKQLDLQSLLTAVGRCISQFQGWYDERRSFQRDFIIGLLVASMGFLSLLIWWMRGRLRRNALALLGLAVVTAFVAVRAVGFHHFDELINGSVINLRFNFLFEVSGLVLIAINAWLRLRRDASR